MRLSFTPTNWLWYLFRRPFAKLLVQNTVFTVFSVKPNKIGRRDMIQGMYLLLCWHAADLHIHEAVQGMYFVLCRHAADLHIHEGIQVSRVIILVCEQDDSSYITVILLYSTRKVSTGSKFFYSK